MNSSTPWPSGAKWPDATVAPQSGNPVRAVLKVCALVGLLAAHFVSRQDQAATMPLAARHNYERSYGHSLSLLAGDGFRDVVVADNAESVPVKEFFDLKRDQVTPQEFATYRAAPQPPEANLDSTVNDQLPTTRVLDVYLTAGLWRVFGISWPVLFTFYALVSTGTCWLVFLMGRRLGESFLAGWLAALFFFASPLESYLSAWSIRDTSPLWFTAASFTVLICVVDRFRSAVGNFASYFGLGVVSMVGIGWRTDAAALVPYLGFSLAALLLGKRRRLGYAMAAVAVFAGGSWLTQAAVRSLGSEQAMPVGTGFQMAFYGDATRCNLLALENGFQTHRCDMQTLFAARHYDRVHNGNLEPLVYLSQHYAGVCRQMFLEECRYSGFRWLRGFGGFLFEALDGLRVPYNWDTVVYPGARIETAWPRFVQFEQRYLEPLSDALPYLFPLCLLAAVATGRHKLLSGLLGLFAVYYTAILLVVLPEQKHTAPLLVPLTVIGGVGCWRFLQLGRPANWSAVWDAVRSRRTVYALVAVVGVGIAYEATCRVARQISSRQRREILDKIETLCQSGSDAPETLKGKKVFSVSLAPGAPNDMQGYLLKLKAGAESGVLYCRHIHFPHDWGWPRLMTTRHCVRPDLEQYFFVSCWQAGRYGDPRPYSCTVSLDGDTEIESCTRVDMAQWDGLPVSMLFDKSLSVPGNPRSIEPNSELTYAGVTVFRATSNDRLQQSRVEKQSQFVAPVVPGPPSRPLWHLLARNEKDGIWHLAVSNGWQFRPLQMTWLVPNLKAGELYRGDFDGDGIDDLAGREVQDGAWWVAAPDGGALPFHPGGNWTGGAELVDLQTGDFNGDGLDDLAGRDGKTGQWRVGLSNGRQFNGQDWGGFGESEADAAADWRSVVVGDFNGDGRADLAGRDATTGQWRVAISNGHKFVVARWGEWSRDADWRHLLVGDFNGDGKTDLAGWNAKTGQWTLALSDGGQFAHQTAGVWSSEIDWRDVRTGDFNGDGQTDILARDPQTNQFTVALSEGTRLENRAFGDAHLFADELWIGDFDGDGMDDVAGRDEATGRVTVGLSNGLAFRPQSWGELLPGDKLGDLRSMTFWRWRR